MSSPSTGPDGGPGIVRPTLKGVSLNRRCPASARAPVGVLPCDPHAGLRMVLLSPISAGKPGGNLQRTGPGKPPHAAIFTCPRNTAIEGKHVGLGESTASRQESFSVGRSAEVFQLTYPLVMVGDSQ